MPAVEIEFEADDGVVLRGALVRPAGRAPCPAVVMAHGAGAHKEWHLPRLAARLADVGIASLTYDNRSFGASGGEPRCEIDPVLQVRDYRSAISCLLDRADVTDVGAFGTSMSGGVVLAVAGMDHRLSCVVAQVPFFDGADIYSRRYGEAETVRLRKEFDADRIARFRGSPATYVPHSVEDVEDASAGRTPNRVMFFQQLDDAQRAVWENRLTLRSLELMGEFSALPYLPRIAPTPLLLVMVEAEMSWGRSACETALEPKKVVVLPGDHYDVYMAGRDRAEQEAVDWLAAWLPRNARGPQS